MEFKTQSVEPSFMASMIRVKSMIIEDNNAAQPHTNYNECSAVYRYGALQASCDVRTQLGTSLDDMGRRMHNIETTKIFQLERAITELEHRLRQKQTLPTGDLVHDLRNEIAAFSLMAVVVG